MLQGLGTFLGAGAVVYAARKGAETFDSWRQQKFAERKRDEAERILTAAYKARRALQGVRSPMMWSHELAKAETRLKEEVNQWALEDEARRKRLTMGQAYFNRLDRTLDEQRELTECLPMARALFGEHLEVAINDLNHQFWIVQIDVESYVDDTGKDPEFTKKIRRGMYDVSPRDGETNEVSTKIATSIEAIEKDCLPALRLDMIS